MIRKGFAETAGLEGRPVLLNLVRSGGDMVQWSNKAYFIPLVDRDGNTRIILAQEMEKITETVEDVNVTAAAKLFPQVTSYADIMRPRGNIDLLVGIHCMEIQPSLIACCGNLGL